MSLVIPRLDRSAAIELVEVHKSTPLEDLSAKMPDLTPVVTYAPIGGQRIETERLESLRRDLKTLAEDHGMPSAIRNGSVFEGLASELIFRELQMSPYEASHDEVWSYVTCCWLLDIAFWRFGPSASEDRFVGHLNRNTFRRMWWRSYVLGADVDLKLLGEDELVNIMERPTLFKDRRLAQEIAKEFLSRVERGDVPDRMRLMREATKRVLRLTPFMSFPALSREQLQVVVGDAFDAASAGLEGKVSTMPVRMGAGDLAPSPTITELVTVAGDETIDDRQGDTPQGRVTSMEEVAEAAIEIAKRTGRVTNTALREAAPVTSEQARRVFAGLMEEGALVRRGVRRGTHYVLPDIPIEVAKSLQRDPGSSKKLEPEPGEVSGRPSSSALRRLLRRGD